MPPACFLGRNPGRPAFSWLWGAARRRLWAEMGRELSLLALLSCAAGLLLGGPLAFSLYLLIMLLALGARAIRGANILEIIQESHRSEPIREVKAWYGRAGIALTGLGAFAGYLAPGFFIRALHWYPPALVSGLFYLPALAGIYMILLHTVVNGWRKGKRRQNLITVSMMKFQGRQTVRNMLVMTLLIAGACFAAFYTPMLSTQSQYSFAGRPVDFEYHWRNDQELPGQSEVNALAGQYGMEITSWAQAQAACLGGDGMVSVEKDNGALGTTYTTEYRAVTSGSTFFSESSWNALTGQKVDLAPGTCANVLDDEGGGGYRSGGDVTRVTNMVTGRSLTVAPARPLRFTMLLGCYVLDDTDYAFITAGLTDFWRETYACFNVADPDASYPFADALFNRIVDCSGPEVEVFDAWDPVCRQLQIQETGRYNYDSREYLKSHDLPVIDYAQRDSSDFRNYWLYMPQFRVLDQNDFITTMAVFLMLFLFIALICFGAVLVIAFTRCMTLALTNAHVYEDLRRLGAPGPYLYRSIKGQVSRVFLVPSLLGMALISGFYLLILYFNDGRLTLDELAGLGSCALVMGGLAALLFLFYRFTLARVCRCLKVRPAGKGL